jgi:hypothetical protein
VTADEFVELVRRGSEKLRVDNVVIEAGEIRLRGRGLLRIGPESLEIDLTLNGRKIPAHPRVVTKRDLWRLSGVISGQLPFRCDTVSPGGNARSSNGIVTITRRLHHVELVADPFDSPKAKRQRRNLQKQFGLKPSSEVEDRSFEFEATIVDCPLPAANGGTETTLTNDFLGETRSSSLNTFRGELATVRYALIRAKNGNDLDIYFRSKEGCESVSEAEDWRQFRAFLAALAFANGVQPWPFRIEYTRGGHRVSETIRAPCKPSSTSYSPLNEAIGFSEPEAFASAIKAAAEFLKPKTELNRQLTNLLFLFREAGKDSVQLEIRILACCALLESLVRTIFKEICLHQSDAPDAIDSERFTKLKNNVLRGATRLLNSKNAREHRRLCDRIKDASALQIQEVFKAVAQRLAISWEDAMQPLFSEWKRARNPAAHGRFKPDMEDGREQKKAERMFFGMSRVAGGFNMILLRLFGYSGRYRSSALEDKYRKL